MKKTLLITALIVLFTGILFAQNEDKDTRLRTEQYMMYEAFEASLDAFRNTFVPGYSIQIATIDSGGTISDSLDFRDGRVIAFIADTAWKTANLSFLTWNPLSNKWVSVYGHDGTEVAYTFTDTTYTAGEPVKLAGLRYLKIRSGTKATPVAQINSDKRIGVILRRY
jgi:hypothetical protein